MRPQIWAPFRISWAADYQLSTDGRVRDRHRNILPERGSDLTVVLTVAGTRRRESFPKRELLAAEWLGNPPRSDCVICGRGAPYRVVHLDGNWRNYSRENLKYVPDDKAARRHELACIKWAMESNGVPPRRETAKKRLQRRNYDRDDWGSTVEDIPPLGINKGQRKTCARCKETRGDRYFSPGSEFCTDCEKKQCVEGEHRIGIDRMS